jgi:hypothetical protein
LKVSLCRIVERGKGFDELELSSVSSLPFLPSFLTSSPYYNTIFEHTHRERTAFAQNSGWDLQVYGDGKDPLKITLQDRWGNLPTLVQGVNAKIELPYPASRIKGWALNERGQPQTELPVEDTTLGRCFVAIGSRWRTLWYGLEAKD